MTIIKNITEGLFSLYVICCAILWFLFLMISLLFTLLHHRATSRTMSHPVSVTTRNKLVVVAWMEIKGDLQTSMWAAELWLVCLSGSGLKGRTAPPSIHQSERKPASPRTRWPLIYSLKAQLMQHWTKITQASHRQLKATDQHLILIKRARQEFSLFTAL